MVVPQDDEEHMVIDIWTLSLTGGFSSAQCDVGLIGKMCKRYKLDEIEVIRMCKNMTNTMNSIKNKKE